MSERLSTFYPQLLPSINGRSLLNGHKGESESLGTAWHEFSEGQDITLSYLKKVLLCESNGGLAEPVNMAFLLWDGGYEEWPNVLGNICHIRETSTEFYNRLGHMIGTDATHIKGYYELLHAPEVVNNEAASEHYQRRYDQVLANFPGTLNLVKGVTLSENIEVPKLDLLLKRSFCNILNMDVQASPFDRLDRDMVIILHSLLVNIGKVQRGVAVDIDITNDEQGQQCLSVVDFGPGFDPKKFEEIFPNGEGELKLKEGAIAGMAGNGNGTVDLSRVIAKKNGTVTVLSYPQDGGDVLHFRQSQSDVQGRVTTLRVSNSRPRNPGEEGLHGTHYYFEIPPKSSL